MDEFTQFEGNKPSPAAGPLDCNAVESWLAEAAEEKLPTDIAAQVREHTGGCANCAGKLAQARRGHEWLQVLKHEKLGPPADLVFKIVARTSGAALPSGASPSGPVAVQTHTGRAFLHVGRAGAMEVPGNTTAASAGAPAATLAKSTWQRSSLMALRHKAMEPRLALVAAMAFFSISLTLDLVGIHLTKVRAADLQPENIRRAVTRQYAQANAHVVRYYENLRIVYEVESRVHQLRRAAETDPQPPSPSDKPGNGSSDSSRDPGRSPRTRREGMAGSPGKSADKNKTSPDPTPVAAGPRMDVSLPSFQEDEVSAQIGRFILTEANDLAQTLTESELTQSDDTLAVSNSRSSGEERRLA
jgi:hypothetical protein